jgi:IS5 family transposase
MKVHEHEDLLRAARRQAERPDHQNLYRSKRPMVERSLAWLVRGGNRRLRYRGISKNDQWLHHRAAGLNLRRLLNLGLQLHQGNWVLA